MKYNFFLLITLLFSFNTTLSAKANEFFRLSALEVKQDSSRLAELDQYLNEVSRTVNEGDFEGYKALYHEDAVVVYATRENKTSISISKALAGWKQGFEDTKAGKADSNVSFRLSQRINDENTAHETGMFHYTSVDNDGKVIASSYVHYEMLLVKKEGQWLALMEYQKSVGTEAEWEALK
jgi:ketosteroid isomerase-like protein